MSDRPLFEWDWIADHTDEIVERLNQHVELTVLSILIGLAIAFPLALYAYRHRRFYGPLVSVTGVLYTIPSLALFAFLVPYTGLSTTTAEVGLVSYTLLILIRNIVVGLDGVSEDVREAARGMGYSARQLLWRVELPIAVPVIITGIRIATVTTIGLVTVTALIGQGGMGHFILLGLRTFNNTAALLGATVSIALAVVADVLLLGIQRLLTPWARALSARAIG
ncbi:MAG: ABC transporter permease [Actinomycetota bacterium]